MHAGIVWIALASLLASPSGAVERTRVPRASLAAMEASLDARMARLWQEPYLLLGLTRGIYLDGYGAVFTAEMNLVTAPGITPFHPEVSKEDVLSHRNRKLERLPILRDAMRKMLVETAASLDGVPAEEQVVLGVILTRYPWENSGGMPAQILMVGQRKKLLDAQRAGGPVPDSVIRVQEY